MVAAGLTARNWIWHDSRQVAGPLKEAASASGGESCRWGKTCWRAFCRKRPWFNLNKLKADWADPGLNPTAAAIHRHATPVATPCRLHHRASEVALKKPPSPTKISPNDVRAEIRRDLDPRPKTALAQEAAPCS